MKAIVTLGLVVLATGLAGCAPAPLTKADVDGRVICNADQMDQVERAARRDRKELHWVNCPQVTLRAV
jgi:hypothetical protein